MMNIQNFQKKKTVTYSSMLTLTGLNNPEDGASLDTSNYVPAEQISDIAATIFHELNDQSIQHLVYNIGLRILERFPQLKDVSYYTNNTTLIEVTDTDDGKGK